MINDFDSALRTKIFESFSESMNDIMGGLNELEKNYQQDEFLNYNTREKVLEAGYILETAVYRIIVYKLDAQGIIQAELQKLNSIVNALALKTDHEFFKLFNLKIVSLISLYLI